nr:MAG TPA: hypothetical protein [Caudoviricetes sp.]
MNPGEAAKLLNEIDITKVMQQVTEVINDFAKKLPEILDGMAKTIRAAVEQIDTEQLKEYLQQYEEGRNDTAAIIELKEDKD